MRINIITQPLFTNYGGILQNYALQEVLRRLGHEPLTVNVPPRKVKKIASWKDHLKTVRNMIMRWQGNYAAPFLNPHTLAVKERELSFPQREFVRKYIDKKDVKAPFSSETAVESPADLWIVGSDQVWRPWCNSYIENEFFDFLDDDTPRIAYAASFGTDQWEIPENKTPKIKELARKFKGISVREASGVMLCKDYLDLDVLHVLDPTMLLDAEDYLALTSENDYPHGKYLATYVLDVSKDKANVIKSECRHRKLTEVKVGIMRKDSYDTIESWLATIAHAECVITDSFHGTVFSIILGRPVKVLKNGLRGNSRLDSLLNLLNLTPDSDGFIRIDKESMERLNELRDKSLDFLIKSLIKNG